MKLPWGYVVNRVANTHDYDLLVMGTEGVFVDQNPVCWVLLGCVEPALSTEFRREGLLDPCRFRVSSVPNQLQLSLTPPQKIYIYINK